MAKKPITASTPEDSKSGIPMLSNLLQSSMKNLGQRWEEDSRAVKTDGDEENETIEDTETLTDEEKGLKMFAAVMSSSMADAMVKALKSDKGSASADASAVTLASGLAIRSGGARSADEILEGKVQISRHDRGNTPEAKQKFRARKCVALPVSFAIPNYDGILSGSSPGDDVGSIAANVQLAVGTLKNWAVAIDVAYVTKVPALHDFSDIRQVVTATHFNDLLMDHTALTPNQAALFQEFINLNGAA
jgi:hypothetical protein